MDDQKVVEKVYAVYFYEYDFMQHETITQVQAICATEKRAIELREEMENELKNKPHKFWDGVNYEEFILER